MKWIALVLLLGAIPALAALLRSYPGSRQPTWISLGLLPFIVEKANLDVAPVSWPMWPGYAKGFELSAIDVIAVAVLLSSGRLRWPRFTVAWVLYVAVATASIAVATMPMASAFGAWQALRVMVVFLAVARICIEPQGPAALLKGMMLGIMVNAGASILQHLGGVYQAPGLFAHQNILGMMAHFIAFPAAAMVLARREPFALLAVAAAVIVAILSASRATVGLQAAGYLLLAVLSVARRRTPRNFAFLAGAMVAMTLLAPVALSVLAPRFIAAETGGYDERGAFEKAARAMIADHPLGVGSNQYVLIANNQGYSDMAGVAWNMGSRAANVHNSYLMMMAEQGYWSLVPLLLLLLGPPIVALRGAYRYRRSQQGALLLACAVSGLIVAAHCFFEWVFFRYPVQVVFAANIGMIAGLLFQCEAGARRRAREARAAFATGDTEERAVASARPTAARG